MVGDLRFGRTVHSLSKLLSLFEDLRISLISPEALSMPEAVVETLREAGHEVLETDVLETGIADVDIVYSTRIQEERFASPEGRICTEGDSGSTRASIRPTVSPTL